MRAIAAVAGSALTTWVTFAFPMTLIFAGDVMLDDGPGRLIEQGGIRMNDAVISDIHATITADQLPAVLQVGKRKFIKLVAQ